MKTKLGDPEARKALDVRFIHDWLQEMPRAILSVTNLGDIASEIRTKERLSPKQTDHVVLAVAREFDALTARLSQLEKASAALAKERAAGTPSTQRKRSRGHPAVTGSATPENLGAGKARRLGARDDSVERRVAFHALAESSYEFEYQKYRESMPAIASAGVSEEELRANFMRDHARRIARKATAKSKSEGPVLQLPEESESALESDVDAPDTAELDSAIQDWGAESDRSAEETVQGRRS